MSYSATYLLQLRAEFAKLYHLPDTFPRFALVLLDEESARIAANIIGADL